MIMYKKYVRPEMEVYQMNPEPFLRQSGVGETDVDLGGGYPDDPAEEDDSDES